MWIYGAYRHWGTYNTVAGSFKDADFTEFPYYSCAPNAGGACTTEQNLFPVWHRAADARLTTQVGGQEQDQPVLRLAVHLLRQLLRADAGDGDQRLPRVQEHSAVHRPGQLELAGHQQAAARGGRHADAAGLPRLSAPGRSGDAVPGQRSRWRLRAMPTTWGSANDVRPRTAATSRNYRASASYVTGSHAVKVGFTLMHQWRLSTTEPNNSVSLPCAIRPPARRGDRMRTAVPADAVRDADPDPGESPLQHGDLRAGPVDASGA